MAIKANTLIEDRYKIIEKIGHGSTAEVFKAKDLKTNKLVALKISIPFATVSNNQQRFLLEAEILLKLDNPNVVKVYGVTKYDDRTIIIMEFINGKDLNYYLKQDKLFTEVQSVRLILQTINGLKDLHKLNIMHRDIKPSNIMLGSDGRVKLMDFGIAQIDENQGLTKEGRVIGTPEYIAPEILNGTFKASQITEIYSLGVLLYKLVTGVIPFLGNTDQETAQLAIIGDHLTANEVDPKIDIVLSNIIEKMIAYEHVERYQSLDELEVELTKYLKGEIKAPETKKKISLFRKRKED